MTTVSETGTYQAPRVGWNVLRDTGMLVTLVGLLTLWVLYGLQLYLHWGGESYYNFGWGIPALTLFILYRRWQDRPALQPPGGSLSTLAIGLIFILALAIFPFRMLSEVNPYWRQPLILQGLLIFGITVLYTYVYGGLRFTWHLLFPLVFLLTMVPWPFALETSVIQWLTGKVIVVTSQVLNFLGYPALPEGNNIFVAGQETPVNVGEACSGIRSLQALMVAGLFLGEFYRQSWVRRILLLVVAFLLVLVFNNIRSVGLTLAMLDGGQAGYEKWHDPLGNITFIASLLFLFGFAELMNLGRRNEEPVQPRGPDDEDAPHLRWPFPRASVAFLCLNVLVLGVAVEGWFRYHEAKVQPQVGWTIEWPEEKPGQVTYFEWPEQVKKILNFDYGRHARILVPGGRDADLFFYGYTGENRMASVSSYGHSPDICMKSAGATEEARFAQLNYNRGSFNIPLDHFLFKSSYSSGRQPIQVFFAVAENKNMGVDSTQLRALNWKTQVDQVMRGRRDYSRQIILIAIYGTEDAQVGRRTAIALLDQVAVPTTPAEVEPSPESLSLAQPGL